MNRHISSRRTIERVSAGCAGCRCCFATVPALAAEPVTSDAAQVAEGEALYEALCAACHAPDANRIGPAHREVFGSRAGSVDGFSYTPALQSLDVVWDEKPLIAGLRRQRPWRRVPPWGSASRTRIGGAR
ncbi:c-type cytochrome [Roseovarius confluentis]|uniref:c-type cytochrome n=1 Tax=Roseovarius confluentis TaxID=1852027 RepID=UPI003BA876CC